MSLYDRVLLEYVKVYRGIEPDTGYNYGDGSAPDFEEDWIDGDPGGFPNYWARKEQLSEVEKLAKKFLLVFRGLRGEVFAGKLRSALISLLPQARASGSDKKKVENILSRKGAALLPLSDTERMRIEFAMKGSQRLFNQKVVQLPESSPEATAEHPGIPASKNSKGVIFDFIATVQEELFNVSVPGSLSQDLDRVLMTTNSVGPDSFYDQYFVESGWLDNDYESWYFEIGGE